MGVKTSGQVGGPHPKEGLHMPHYCAAPWRQLSEASFVGLCMQLPHRPDKLRNLGTSAQLYPHHQAQGPRRWYSRMSRRLAAGLRRRLQCNHNKTCQVRVVVKTVALATASSIRSGTGPVLATRCA